MLCVNSESNSTIVLNLFFFLDNFSFILLFFLLFKDWNFLFICKKEKNLYILKKFSNVSVLFMSFYIYICFTIKNYVGVFINKLAYFWVLLQF